MQIRKISIGADYKSSAMHYIVGQEILGGNYTIFLIEYDVDQESYFIFIKKKDEIIPWKSFNKNVPICVEFNINF
jgi:hypothetical protein|tara:strand:+ start:112 stop:336 length:225 start_codon:yes stop_codon:yes gene_type:complete